MAKYLYFRASGKYCTDGEGVDLPVNGEGYTREQIRELNGGKMPGVGTSLMEDFILVITDDDASFPRLYPIGDTVSMRFKP